MPISHGLQHFFKKKWKQSWSFGSPHLDYFRWHFSPHPLVKPRWLFTRPVFPIHLKSPQQLSYLGIRVSIFGGPNTHPSNSASGLEYWWDHPPLFSRWGQTSLLKKSPLFSPMSGVLIFLSSRPTKRNIWTYWLKIWNFTCLKNT